MLKLCAVAALYSVLFSCKEPDIIGMEIQPANEKLNVEFCDTISLIAYSQKEDSIRSDETALNLLGSNNDPVFGKNNAGFYTQIRLSSNNAVFDSLPVVDSIVLSLAYKGVYGDTNALQKVNVYELAEDIYKDNAYYSNREFLTAGIVLGTKTFIPKPKDSVKVGASTLAPQLRIRLNDDFGNKIFAASGSGSLSDNSNFVKFIKGIYVSSASAAGEGGIMYFDLLNSQSKITLYYHNSAADSLKYDFVINENCARINHFNHSKYLYADNYLQSEIYGDTLKGENTLYLHSMAGIKIKLRFPYIKDLAKNGKIAVNKASLVIPIDTNDVTSGYYAPPAQLVLIEEKDGLIRFLIDQYDGIPVYGGMYNSAKKEYKFNISRHIQQIIDGYKDNNSLSLVVWTSDRPNTANRVVLNGTKSQTDKLRFQITYTKLY